VSHESVVHGFPSLQVSSDPGTHVPPPHTSFTVHALPSLHGSVLLGFWHPNAVSHVSVVHAFPSLQVSSGPGTHAPPPHASFTVHALPSLHGSVLLVFWHPSPVSHASVVHAFPSSQLCTVPPHTPPVQESPVVHASLSLHSVPLGRG
jgi:hypothetical protein